MFVQTQIPSVGLKQNRNIMKSDLTLEGLYTNEKYNTTVWSHQNIRKLGLRNFLATVNSLYFVSYRVKIIIISVLAIYRSRMDFCV